MQLGRLFGAGSSEASKPSRTSTEWRRTLKRVLHELDRYLISNVDTDELHLQMLQSGLLAADEALKEDAEIAVLAPPSIRRRQAQSPHEMRVAGIRAKHVERRFNREIDQVA